MKFSVLIPNYNSEKWINKTLDSILNQTFEDYEVIIVDDMSTDDSPKIIQSYFDKFDGKMRMVKLRAKRWNGGARNACVERAKGEYIIFMDSDDWLCSNNCFEEIAKVIDDNNNPDLVRLPYTFVGKYTHTILLKEKTFKELAETVIVAPWTKCVKRKIFVPFPENTLLEDVVQHIAQIDAIENFVLCPIPIITWNRKNPNAISADGRKYDKDSKRYSSLYRNLADLIDLKCEHDYCEERRRQRIAFYEDIIHNSKEDSIVSGG